MVRSRLSLPPPGNLPPRRRLLRLRARSITRKAGIGKSMGIRLRVFKARRCTLGPCCLPAERSANGMRAEPREAHPRLVGAGTFGGRAAASAGAGGGNPSRIRAERKGTEGRT